jgi:hypothetical protein
VFGTDSFRSSAVVFVLRLDGLGRDAMIRFLSIAGVFLFAAILAPWLIFAIAFLALWRCFR